MGGRLLSSFLGRDSNNKKERTPEEAAGSIKQRTPGKCSQDVVGRVVRETESLDVKGSGKKITNPVSSIKSGLPPVAASSDAKFKHAFIQRWLASDHGVADSATQALKSAEQAKPADVRKPCSNTWNIGSSQVLPAEVEKREAPTAEGFTAAATTGPKARSLGQLKAMMPGGSKKGGTGGSMKAANEHHQWGDACESHNLSTWSTGTHAGGYRAGQSGEMETISERSSVDTMSHSEGPTVSSVWSGNMSGDQSRSGGTNTGSGQSSIFRNENFSVTEVPVAPYRNNHSFISREGPANSAPFAMEKGPALAAKIYARSRSVQKDETLREDVAVPPDEEISELIGMVADAARAMADQLQANAARTGTTECGPTGRDQFVLRGNVGLTNPGEVSASDTAEVRRGMDETVLAGEGETGAELDSESRMGGGHSGIEAHRRAVERAWHMTKLSKLVRRRMGELGILPALIPLLMSPDVKIQQSAVTAVLNLALELPLKGEIVAKGGVVPLVSLLTNVERSGAREAAIGALSSLSVATDCCHLVMEAGAIPPLVELFTTGTSRGRRDAAIGLFNLSIDDSCRAAIVAQDCVEALLSILNEPDCEIETEVVCLLASLMKVPQVCTLVLQQGGIPNLVAALDGASSKAQAGALSCLLLLATTEAESHSEIVQEGALLALRPLMQKNQMKVKEKAAKLLSILIPTEGNTSKSNDNPPISG